MIEIKTKTELISALNDSNQRATKWFTEIPTKIFFTRKGEVWSASDNMDHLIRSHQPLVKALKLPKITLQAMFGKPQKSSISYEELCQIYRGEIAKGAQAATFQIRIILVKMLKRKRGVYWVNLQKPVQNLFQSLKRGMRTN